MNIFSIDNLNLLLALCLAGLPVLSSTLENRPLTKIDLTSICLGVILAGLTFYSSIENSKKLDEASNRITSFSASVVVNFTWPTGFNPLLDNGNDSSQSSEELMWFSSTNELLKMYSISNGYSINRTGPNSAQYKTVLSPKSGAPPIGMQMETILKGKEFLLFMILKNYWTNGRDNYDIAITSGAVTFLVNNQKITVDLNPSILKPTPAGQTIFGLIEIQKLLENRLPIE